MRNASTQVVYELVKKDRRVLAISSDSRNDIYNKIRLEYPNQYLEYGIAEANVIASAAGLASCGKIPFIYSITNFLSMRAFEFIRNDVCIGNQNVKFLGRCAGLVSSNMGPTHQGTEDIALLRTLPNLIVITPATPIEAKEATKFAYIHSGPVYIRLEGFGEAENFDESYRFELGRGKVLRDGDDVAVIATGSIFNEAIDVAVALEREGISVAVIDMPTVKPIDEDLIKKLGNETRGIITLEEHSIYGGLGSAVAEVLAENGINTQFRRIGLRGCAVGCGSRAAMREMNGLSPEHLLKTIREIAG